MQEEQRIYLPAAGHDWALWLYDPIVKLLGTDKAGRKLVDQAALRPGHRVLDIGCGTGTLAVFIRTSHADVEVVGLDPDPKALARASKKAERGGVSIRFDQGFAGSLPYPDGSFDRVFSSMMFHHLPTGEKEKMLREVRRVLVPGSSFHMMDFAGPEDQETGWLARRIHSSEQLKDNCEQRVLALMNQAGFADASRAGDWDIRLGLGRAYFYKAVAPN